jgi:hypothetical protein
VAGLAGGLAACGDDDDELGQKGGGDLEVINYALTLEFLEADFYDEVVRSGVLSGRELAIASEIRRNEQEHVDALTAAARKFGKPVARPSTSFEQVISGGRDEVLRTAAKLENLGAAAYLGQARNITSRDVLKTALAIHTVEARHAGVLNHLIGKSFVPDGALATPMTRNEVLREAEPFLAT